MSVPQALKTNPTGKQTQCIDLKSFYATVECVERGLDPMTTDLVVADPERTEKTICLAVSPSLKARGVPGRARVFEIPKSFTYIMAPPRMAKYIEYSANIYAIYLRYFSKDDIHVYSIDEAFMDVTNYLPLYKCTARELGERIRTEILDEIGIPATCGIGPNLYLAKLALDITAKHSKDFFGELDEASF
ncbi:MAG: DNA repair protein, partial [Eggerthellaceae bacterium]|nr:DNA repair protein [Eggerthellaceae bacterium]